MNVETMRTDGNAAAGVLSEIFLRDLTTARATCAHCGDTGSVGALMAYAHGMGTVLRCSGCEAVVLRIARTPTRIWLDASGATCIVIDCSEA